MNILTNEDKPNIDYNEKCPVCGQPKWCYIEQAKAHFKVACLCVQKQQEQEAVRIAKEKRAQWLKERQMRAQINKRYENAFFATTDADRGESFQKAFGIAKKYVENFARHLDNYAGMYLWGKVGTGKTHLAYCIANELLAKGYLVIVTSFSDIVRLLKKPYDQMTVDEDTLFFNLTNADLLVIDDLGYEQLTDFTSEKINSFVNLRYNSMKPMVITSNFQPTELVQKGFELKTIERINEGAVFKLQVEAESYRKVLLKNQKSEVAE